jgi:hypothetical protein
MPVSEATARGQTITVSEWLAGAPLTHREVTVFCVSHTQPYEPRGV